MDYGHPLIFGVHIHGAPASDMTGAGWLVALAQIAARNNFSYLSLGSDSAADGDALNGLDSWTLGSFAAGATGGLTVRVSADHLTSPVVIARSAASVDLLSGGQAELGFGTDSTADLRDRLYEAITIIRGMWDAGNSTPLSFVGDYYYVPGTQRGPAPAHIVPVWVTGFSDDSLHAAGELADGWMFTLGDLRETSALGESAVSFFDENVAAGLRRAVHTVDSQAVANGRDPREIRRQVLVKPEQVPGVVERDASQAVSSVLALADAGFAEILFDTPGSETLEWLGQTVYPTVSDRLAAQREAAGVQVGVMRNIAVRARRIGAIDYESMPALVRTIAVEPGDSSYSNYQNTYLRGGHPGVVLRPRTADEVAASVKWANTQNVPFSIRSGGHGFSGKSTNNGGIVLSLRELRDITVLDPDEGLVRIEPGAQWAEVAAALEPFELAISSGDSGAVGVGGLATVGGIGFFSKQHGLTIDYIQAMEIVTAAGDLVRASESENPELFWGMRGAGPNFGIVTAFEFKAQKTGLIVHAQLAFQVDSLSEFLYQYGQAVQETPRDTTMFLMAGPPRPGQPQIAQLYGVVDSADETTILSRLQRFVDLAPLVGQQVYLTTYAGAIGAPVTGPQHGSGEPIGRSGALANITREAAEELTRLVNSGATNFFQIRTAGGAASAVPEDQTAFAGRHNVFHVLAMGTSKPRIDSAWERLSEHFDGYYLNFETDVAPERVKTAFTAEKWERLVALKRQWDPQNLLKDNFNIEP